MRALSRRRRLFPRELACYLAGILMFRIYGDAPLGNSWTFAALTMVVLASVFVRSPVSEAATTLVAAPLLVRNALALTASRATAWLGALSYPLYATHHPVMLLTLRFGGSPGAAFACAMVVAVMVTLAFEVQRKSWSVPASWATAP